MTDEAKKTPQARTIKIDATPEHVAKAMFAAARPVNPNLRKIRRPRKR
ncbi:MAG: hypothetical protein OXG37_11570 [Actinomycetia bacterium]|nr:hypothetical protein [Actinomycetes bacterium]